MKTIYHIAEIAVRAMLYEAAATPKPGLVDRVGNGAHADMDFFKFMDSSAALAPWMYRLAESGWRYTGSPADMFAALRPVGAEAEQAMRRATGGVNTHRGLIFSLGLACASAACLARQTGVVSAARLCRYMAMAVRGICERELQPLGPATRKRRLTAGEKVFRAHGITGVRGEIENGLPLVRQQGLPALRKALKRNGNINDASVHALICILEKIMDTTILHRGDMAAMLLAQKTARGILRSGSVFTADGRRQLALAETLFVKQNISPGGAADMLALSLACFFWEREIGK